MSEFCFYYTLFQVILFFINRKNKTCCYTNEQVQKLSTMSNLYQELAAIYQAMYHTFMDYDSELEFYSKIFSRSCNWKCSMILYISITKPPLSPHKGD